MVFSPCMGRGVVIIRRNPMQSGRLRLIGAVQATIQTRRKLPMLESMRNAAQHVVGKAIMTVVMGLIIVSFVIWGVGDMLRGFTASNVATVGAAKISSQDFRYEFQRTLQQYQRRLRQPFTTEQARAIGLDRQVLQRLVSEAAIDEEAPQARARRLRRRAARDDYVEPGFPGQVRRLRPAEVRLPAARQRPQRARLRRRAQEERAAPIHHRRARDRPRRRRRRW